MFLNHQWLIELIKNHPIPNPFNNFPKCLPRSLVAFPPGEDRHE